MPRNFSVKDIEIKFGIAESPSREVICTVGWVNLKGLGYESI